MLVQEDMLAHRVFRVFRVSAVISGQKAILAVKAHKVISDRRDPRVQPDQPGLRDRRVISGHRDQEVFLDRPGLRDRPDLWGRRV